MLYKTTEKERDYMKWYLREWRAKHPGYYKRYHRARRARLKAEKS